MLHHRHTIRATQFERSLNYPSSGDLRGLQSWSTFLIIKKFATGVFRFGFFLAEEKTAEQILFNRSVCSKQPCVQPGWYPKLLEFLDFFQFKLLQYCNGKILAIEMLDRFESVQAWLLVCNSIELINANRSLIEELVNWLLNVV